MTLNREDQCRAIADAEPHHRLCTLSIVDPKALLSWVHDPCWGLLWWVGDPKVRLVLHVPEKEFRCDSVVVRDKGVITEVLPAVGVGHSDDLAPSPEGVKDLGSSQELVRLSDDHIAWQLNLPQPRGTLIAVYETKQVLVVTA